MHKFSFFYESRYEINISIDFFFYRPWFIRKDFFYKWMVCKDAANSI